MPVFTTGEIAACSKTSLSNTVQRLNYLARQGFVIKIYKGIWAEAGQEKLNPYIVIPYLFSRSRVYVSFISALHLYGFIEQIPQVITLASISHSKKISTAIATYIIHQITPDFFCGFDWYKGTGDFLIAEQEKALVDSLYLSARKKKQYRFFPEISFPGNFNVQKAFRWARKIKNIHIRIHVISR